MAFIKSFEITGLAGRNGTYKQSINQNLAIFFGLNGSGKTSLLRILDSAMSMNVSTILRTPFSSAVVVVHDPNTEKDYTLRFEKPLDSDTEELAFAYSRDRQRFHLRPGQPILWEHELTWSCEEPLPASMSKGWQHTFLPTSRLFPAAALRESSLSADDALDWAFERLLEREWMKHFGAVQAQLRRHQEHGLARILQLVIQGPPSRQRARVRSVPDTETAYSKTKAFLRRRDINMKVPPFDRFQEKFEQDSLLRAVVFEINKIEDLIEQDLRPTSRLQTLVESLFSGPKRVEFAATKIDVIGQSDQKIGLRSLSSGEKQMIYLLVEAVAAENSTLLIDEPELSMHADWQRSFVEAVFELNPKVQLVLATHSPDMMAYVEDSHIFRLPD